MIIPVMDIKNNIAVSGKSGNRDEYQPLKTVFAPSAHPLEIVKALKEKGAQELYIADLDSIEHKGSNLDLVGKINKLLPVMLDCGAHDPESVTKALKFADKVIVATETLKSMDDLHQTFAKVDRQQIILSIDLVQGQIYSRNMDLDWEKLRENLERLKPSQIIILDISKVGTRKGVDWDVLDQLSGLGSIILGGGITSNDLEDISRKGVSKVLVGTDLHSGKMEPLF
ncbi:hisA/hisF family protein [Methanobacterium sp. MB1]|nr:hisA/hisF family protein [Methanobacterium sp. MB1]